jgi:tetratricopeptide (TPR) repeat protein
VILTSLAGEPTAHRARLVHARLLERSGHRDEARALYRRLISAYNDDVIGRSDAEGLSYVAVAASRLGAIRDANQAFVESTRADRARVETQREWAQLFVSKRDYGHAEESLEDALTTNPDDPRTLVALARLRIERDYDFEGASRPLARALAIAPNLVEAHVLGGSIALFGQDFDEASAAVMRARATDPTSLDAATLSAAIAFVRADPAAFEQERAAVFAIDPSHTSFYTALSVFAEWEHRYPDMVAFAREALAIDRSNASAWSLLGLQLLHEGDEAEALEALRQAWSRDHYDVMVFNTLNLYDDVITPGYDDFAADPFRFRVVRQERAVLEEPLPRILGSAYRDMVNRYGFTPEGPLRFELYATAEHFSVRTAGLPNIGIQGVCFGKMVAAMSPSAGSFDWAAITWHELAHVFHIQLSHNRVPRWLTEGLAEYETSIARPEWRRELDHVLVAALEADALPPMARMNEAFTHARSAEESVAAYHASSEIAAYLVERFGFPKVVELLRGFREEVRFEVLAERVLGVPSSTLDTDFRRVILERNAATRSDARLAFHRYRDREAIAHDAATRANDAVAIAALAAAELVSGNSEAAVAAAERALAIEPGDALALFVRARVRLEARDPAAEADLRAIVAVGRGSYVASMILARLAHARHQNEAAIHELEAAYAFDPRRPDALAGLVELTHGTAPELLWTERYLAVEEHDREAFARYVELLDAAHATARIAALEERIERLDPMNRELRLVLVSALTAEGNALAARRHRQVADRLVAATEAHRGD